MKSVRLHLFNFIFIFSTAISATSESEDDETQFAAIHLPPSTICRLRGADKNLWACLISDLAFGIFKIFARTYHINMTTTTNLVRTHGRRNFRRTSSSDVTRGRPGSCRPPSTGARKNTTLDPPTTNRTTESKQRRVRSARAHECP